MSTATLDAPLHGWASRLRLGVQVTASMVVMTLGAIVMLLVAIVTGFRLRRFYSECLAAKLGQMLLAIFGVRFVVHQSSPYPRHQVVYISNHTSTIDMFVLIALRLPNARFFLSGFLRKLVPLGIIGYLIGMFWTVPQERQAARRRIFRRAARTLSRSGESVYLSPEGERITSGRIGHFNKGAFHLATALHAPIVPLFIRIPRAMDPGKGLGAQPGTVHVHVGAPIDTSSWREADVALHRDQVRARYETWHAEMNALQEQP
jgi:1-acyl-sn-glycerol-3-phosphate acyltransferase